MKVVGEAAARGSAQTVWDALHDPAVLTRAIPGCEHFEVCGPGLGQFIAATTLPAIGGTYAGKLTIAEQQPPNLLRLTASATGEQGSLTADVTLRLTGTAEATTLVSFEANGTVTGSVAGAGTRLLASAAKRLADEFFAAIDESVAAAAEPTAAQPAAAEPTRPVSHADRPGRLVSPGSAAGDRTALIAGAAIGLAGVIIGVLAGRRGRRGHGSGRARARE